MSLYSFISCHLQIGSCVHVVYVDGVSLRNAANKRPTVHPTGDIRAWRATVERYRQGKTEELGEALSQCHLFHHRFHMD
jgi:hypothetical protein